MASDQVRAQSQVHGPVRGTAVRFGAVPPRCAAVWRVSSRSTGSTSCVEATTYDDVVAVRNSTDPTGPLLAVPACEWLAFLDEVLAGRVTYPRLHDRTVAGRVLAGPFAVRRVEDGAVELAEQRPDSPAVRFTQLEWEVFVAGVVLDREFTLEWLLEAAEPQPA